MWGNWIPHAQLGKNGNDTISLKNTLKVFQKFKYMKLPENGVC